jgi:hypothetical protein
LGEEKNIFQPTKFKATKTVLQITDKRFLPTSILALFCQRHVPNVSGYFDSGLFFFPGLLPVPRFGKAAKLERVMDIREGIC